MTHWLLTPVDHEHEIWKTYLVQRIVVEAANEEQARRQVAEDAPSASDPEEAAPNPWLDPGLTTCEEAKEHDITVATG